MHLVQILGIILLSGVGGVLIGMMVGDVSDYLKSERTYLDRSWLTQMLGQLAILLLILLIPLMMLVFL